MSMQELVSWGEKKRMEWVETAPGLLPMMKAESDGTKAANNARYIELRKSGMTADESLSTIAAEQGKKRTEIAHMIPAWGDDNGSLEDLLAEYAA